MSYGNNSHNLKQNNNYIWWIRQKHKDATNIQIQTERETEKISENKFEYFCYVFRVL